MANTYTMWLTVGGVPITPCNQANIVFTIVPLAPDPQHSTLQLPANAQVGTQQTITVTVRDIYNNAVTQASNFTVQIGVQPLVGGPVCTGGANPPLLDLSAQNILPVYQGNGVYTFTFTYDLLLLCCLRCPASCELNALGVGMVDLH